MRKKKSLSIRIWHSKTTLQHISELLFTISIQRQWNQMNHQYSMFETHTSIKSIIREYISRLPHLESFEKNRNKPDKKKENKNETIGKDSTSVVDHTHTHTYTHQKCARREARQSTDIPSCKVLGSLANRVYVLPIGRAYIPSERFSALSAVNSKCHEVPLPLDSSLGNTYTHCDKRGHATQESFFFWCMTSRYNKRQ